MSRAFDDPRADRISFTLSNLNHERGRRRLQPDDDLERPAAAVAGVVDGIDAGPTTRVEASREPPPTLKPPRRPCFTLLTALWTMSLCVAGSFFCVHEMLIHIEADRVSDRHLVRDATIRDVVEFGVWDSRLAVSSLQLQVSVSMAVGVRADDGDVAVQQHDNHFFVVRVDHATAEETDFLGSAAFLERLNDQLQNYGGLAVLSIQPQLKRNHTTVVT